MFQAHRQVLRSFTPKSVLGLKAFCGLVLGCMMAVSLGCQTQPTRTAEVAERKLEPSVDMLRPIKITDKTVIIDARPSFDYSTAHIPRSVPLRWADFTEPEKAQQGVLQGDLFAAARRLARMGIGPGVPIVVVGRGLDGNGEEGRVAWMLSYLGVEGVQFTDIDALKARLTNLHEEAAPKSVPSWKPEPVEVLNVTRDEVIEVINRKGVHRPMALTPNGQPTLYRIIDVRESKDYLGRGRDSAQPFIPNIDSINVPWREFFDKDGRINAGMAKRLKDVGILPEYRIIVLDEQGVASGAVTMALQAMGFSKAGNYSGGLIDLVSRPMKRR